jgi:hypothetical protein
MFIFFLIYLAKIEVRTDGYYFYQSFKDVTVWPSLEFFHISFSMKLSSLIIIKLKVVYRKRLLEFFHKTTRKVRVSNRIFSKHLELITNKKRNIITVFKDLDMHIL